MDQPPSPMPQRAADAAKNAHARRVRLEVRAAARPQLNAAISPAPPSPMSSTAIVAWSPPMRKAVHVTKAAARTAAAAAAIVKTRQPRKPKPLTTLTESRMGAAKRPVGGACRRAGAKVGEGDLANTSPVLC